MYGKSIKHVSHKWKIFHLKDYKYSNKKESGYID